MKIREAIQREKKTKGIKKREAIQIEAKKGKQHKGIQKGKQSKGENPKKDKQREQVKRKKNKAKPRF